MSTELNYLTPRRRNAVAGLARCGIAANVVVFTVSSICLPLVGLIMMIAGAACLVLDRIISLVGEVGRRAVLRSGQGETPAVFAAEQVIARVQKRFGYSCDAVPMAVAGKSPGLAIRFSLAHLFAPRTATLDDHARHFLTTMMQTIGHSISRLDIVIRCYGDEECTRNQAAALARGIRDAGVFCPIGEFVVVGQMAGEHRGPSIELIVRGQDEELPRAA